VKRTMSWKQDEVVAAVLSKASNVNRLATNFTRAVGDLIDPTMSWSADDILELRPDWLAHFGMNPLKRHTRDAWEAWDARSKAAAR
jgi:hypothetical protein